MKIFTPEGTELMTITGVEPFEGGILISGTIMGAMPMRGMVRPEELRAGRSFLSWRLAWTAATMLFRRTATDES